MRETSSSYGNADSCVNAATGSGVNAATGIGKDSDAATSGYTSISGRIGMSSGCTGATASALRNASSNPFGAVNAEALISLRSYPRRSSLSAAASRKRAKRSMRLSTMSVERTGIAAARAVFAAKNSSCKRPDSSFDGAGVPPVSPERKSSYVAASCANEGAGTTAPTPPLCAATVAANSSVERSGVTPVSPERKSSNVPAAFACPRTDLGFRRARDTGTAAGGDSL